MSRCLFNFGFVQSCSDYSLFTLCSGNVFIALLVYVDDIVLTGNSKGDIHRVKQHLKTNFLIKDLGSLQFFLGIEILKSENGLCMSQRKYCLELLNDFGYLGCKPINTPMDMNLVVTDTVSSSDPPLADISGYQR